MRSRVEGPTHLVLRKKSRLNSSRRMDLTVKEPHGPAPAEEGSRLLSQCSGSPHSQQSCFYTPPPRNKGNLERASSCLKPSMVPVFQRVKPKCLALQAEPFMMSRPTVSTCVCCFSREQAVLSPCCLSPWGTTSPSLTLPSSSFFDQWRVGHPGPLSH